EGILVDGPHSGAVATITESIVRDTVLDDRFEGGLAYAISVGGGATVTVTDTALAQNPQVGISVDAATIAATRLTIHDMVSAGFHGFGIGMDFAKGAQGTLTNCAFVSTAGSGILSGGDGTSVTIDRSLVVGNRTIEPLSSPEVGNAGQALI